MSQETLSRNGTETERGAFEKATDAEGNTGTSTTTAVTPSVLKAVFDDKITYLETDNRTKTSADGNSNETVYTCPSGKQFSGYVQVQNGTGTVSYEVLDGGSTVVQQISPGTGVTLRMAVFLEAGDTLRISFNLSAGTATYDFRGFEIATSY